MQKGDQQQIQEDRPVEDRPWEGLAEARDVHFQEELWCLARQEDDYGRRGPVVEIWPPTLMSLGGRGRQPRSSESNRRLQTEDHWQVQTTFWEWRGNLWPCWAQGDEAVQQTEAGLW